MQSALEREAALAMLELGLTPTRAAALSPTTFPEYPSPNQHPA